MLRQAEALAQTARHELQLRAARTFLETCEAHQIQAMPVKGVVTAFTLHATPALRRLRDIDVRVAWSTFPHLRAVAWERGWRTVEQSRAYQNVVFEVEGVHIDVEASVGPPHFCSLAVPDMLARAERSLLLGFPAWIPSFMDHAVLLVVNAFKDKLPLAQPGAIADLTRLVEHPSFDGDILAARLTAAGLSTVGWVVADWMTKLGADRWREVRHALSPERPMYVTLLGKANEHPTWLLTRVLTRAAPDERTARMRSLATMARWQWEAWLRGPPGGSPR